jgi:hypothetical protein
MVLIVVIWLLRAGQKKGKRFVKKSVAKKADDSLVDARKRKNEDKDGGNKGKRQKRCVISCTKYF